MLHVWFRGQQSPLAVWHLDERRWHLVDHWQQLFDIYGIHGAPNITLYFPSQHLLHVESSLTSAQIKQLGISGQQYLFEELFLGSVEKLSVRQFGGEPTQLYAVDKNDIEAWQQSAALVGLNITAMLPDFLLLPIPEASSDAPELTAMTLYQDSVTTLSRQSDAQGLAVNFLPLLLSRLPSQTVIELLPAIDTDDGMASTQMQANTIALIKQQGFLVNLLPIYPEPVLIPERHALNFFAKKSQAVLSPYLKTAVMVALAAWVLQFATNGIELLRYQDAAAKTQSATAAQYQAWFPNEPLNPKGLLQTQLTPKLRQNSSDANAPVAVLSQVSPLIKQSSLTAQTLVLAPDALMLTLIAPDRSSLDGFISHLTTQGLSANLEQVNNTEQNQVLGHVRIIIVPSSADNLQVAPSRPALS